MAAGGASRLAAFHPNLFTYSEDELAVPLSYIGLGRACVAENPQERPSFTEVLSLIEGIRLEAASAMLQAPPPSLAQAPGMGR